MGTTARPEAVREALRRATGAGPFFAVAVDLPEEPAAGEPQWQPLGTLTDGGPVLAARVAAVRAAAASRAGLAPDGVEVRVAASLVHLGLTARLLSPALGAALLGGAVPDLGGLLWRDVVGGPVPLALPTVAGEVAADPDDPAELAALLAPVVDGAIGGLTAAIGSYAVLSPQVLWGNVASALGGAVRVLRPAAPARAALALEVWRRLLDRRPLAGAGVLTLVRAPGADPADAVPPGWSFTRRNCCLFYRVPGGGTCGDCVLNLRPGRA